MLSNPNVYIILGFSIIYNQDTFNQNDSTIMYNRNIYESEYDVMYVIIRKQKENFIPSKYSLSKVTPYNYEILLKRLLVQNQNIKKSDL